MVGGVLSLPALRRSKRHTDPNQQPGAPLLGVNGIVIIAHGSCTHEGIKNALLGIEAEAELGLNEHIQEGIANLRAFDAARTAGADS